ncbi:MAG: glycosyltransferase family 4 protein [Salibacteraceae bacterium]
MSNARKLVILNQAANYLTVGFANAFEQEFDEVVLITGGVHVQGEELNPNIKLRYINKWVERPAKKKALSFLLAMMKMWWLLITRYRSYEVFFVSVPPMGYLLNLVLPHRFSMIIWDVYPDIFKITGMRESNWVYQIWAKLNKISFKKAYRIFTISEKMSELLESYVDSSKIIIQPIWSIFQQNDKKPKEGNPFIESHGLSNKFIVQYSGNIGLTHNVEALLEIAEELKHNSKVLFQIIGRGPRKEILKQMVKERNLPNCQFLPFQSDEMFPYSLSAADLGVVILDETTSKGSVPSKSYNLMSYGIPSLYVASKDSQLNTYAETYSHAKCFSKSELKNASAFVEQLCNDNDQWQHMSVNAVKASKDFKRGNADKFVSLYLLN